MGSSFRVFISHFTGEAKIAEELQNFIRRSFPSLEVFRSSDAESIKTGQGQYQAILERLRTAGIVIVLLSSESAQRPWVTFETGFGMGKKARVFPLLVRGARPKDVPSPFCEMLIRPVTDVEVENILVEIENETRLKREPFDIDALLRAIAEAEAGIPNVRLELEPYITGDRRNPCLSFRLRYEGYEPVELQTIVAGIPEGIRCPGWNPRVVTGHLDNQSRTVDDTPYLFQEYRPSTIPLDPAGDFYKEECIIRCWVVTTKFRTQEQRIPLLRLKPSAESA